MNPANSDTRVKHVLPMGGVFASSNPAEIQTILGSCVAVCLVDPAQRIGGMNHFMLPSRGEHESGYRDTYYGIHAMDLLMNAMMRLGAERKRLQAKVFGAGDLLGFSNGHRSVPESNSTFILSYLQAEAIPLVSQDLGGQVARRVHLFTDTGRVLVKRLSSTLLKQRTQTEERAYERKIIRTMDRPGDITLFTEP